jgi:serine/threonine protein kinase
MPLTASLSSLPAVLSDAQIGQYDLLEQIGEGGMGAVWLGEHVALGRLAAIKVLHPEFSGKREFVKRFFNEARAAAAINDPGIVQIFDFGQHVDGSAYIVMERLEGEGLDQRLARAGRLALRDALRIVRQVASTLATTHAAGIIHRDLKPGNIFLVRDPEVAGGERAKVLDFGIAKLADDSAGVKTRSRAVLGTPNYMAPEQCRGAGLVDERSDVYSLGCVLFTLITGTTPFDAEGFGDVIAMQLHEPPPPPSTRADGIPPEVDHIVLTCLAKDPDQRYPTASALAGAIDSLLERTMRPTLVESRDHTDSEIPKTIELTTLAVASRETIELTTLAAASRIIDGTAPPFGGAAGRARVPAVDGTAPPFGGAAGRARVPAVDGTPITHRARSIAIAGLATIGIGACAIAWASPRAASTDHGLPHPAPATAQPSDPATVTAAHAAALLAAVPDWAATHPAATCPTIDDLGDTSLRVDGWGHAMTIMCSDQGSDRMASVRSAGPDGVADTADDALSSSLGVASVVIGSHTTAAPSAPIAVPVVSHSAHDSHATAARLLTAGRRAAPLAPRGAPAPSVTVTKPAPTNVVDSASVDPGRQPLAVYQLDQDGVPTSRWGAND